MNRKVFAITLIALMFYFISPTLVSAEDKPGNPKYGWVNGKWEGRPPAGGELQMTLRVEKDNQVRGTGLIPGGGKKGARPDVTGTVNGDRVRLETFFPGAFPQRSVIYNCKFAEGALRCKTRGGYETTFKKIE